MANLGDKNRTFREWWFASKGITQCAGFARRPGPASIEDLHLAKIDVSAIFHSHKSDPISFADHAASTHAPAKLRFAGLSGSSLLRLFYIRENQQFERVASPWERMYSPAFGARPMVPDVYSGSVGRVQVEMPVMSEHGTIRGYVLTKYEDDGNTILLVDINGTEVTAEFKARGNIQSDELGNFLLFLIASGGLALIRRGVALLLDIGGDAATAEMLSQAGTKATDARSMVQALRAEGQEVVINVGGEGSASEASQWPRAINLNPIKAGRPLSIPNLVKADGEEIGELFESNSIDKIVSSKLPPSVDAEALARGSARVLRTGGRLEINIFGGGVKAWAETFRETLISKGFDAKNIKIFQDVLIQAIK